MVNQVNRLQYHQFWLFVGWSLVVMVIYFSLNVGGLPGLNSFLHDKLSHLLGYSGLMLWFSQLYKTTKIRSLLAVLLACLGITLEYLQGIGGIRMFEVADMLANATGVALGWILAVAGMDRILGWFESRYLVRC